MRAGFDAAGRLQAIYDLFDGGRDELAEKARVPPTNLSSINSGKRKMGEEVARRILAVAEVKRAGLTIFDLGARAEEAEAADEMSVIDHLGSLQGEVERLAKALTLLANAQQPALRRQLLLLLEGDHR